MRLIKKFRGLSLKVFNSVTNFLLISLGINAEELVKILELHGISIRWCWSFKGLGKDYIRVSIRKYEDNEVLLNVFTQVIKGLKYEH